MTTSNHKFAFTKTAVETQDPVLQEQKVIFDNIQVGQKQNGQINSQSQNLQSSMFSKNKFSFQTKEQMLLSEIPNNIKQLIINTMKYSQKEIEVFSNCFAFYDQSKKEELQKKHESKDSDLLEEYIQQSISSSFKLNNQKKGDKPEIMSMKLTQVGQGATKLRSSEAEYYKNITEIFNKTPDTTKLCQEIITILKQCAQETDVDNKAEQQIFQNVFTMTLQQIYQRIAFEKKFIGAYANLLEQLCNKLSEELISEQKNYTIIQHLKKCSKQSNFKFADAAGQSYNWSKLFEQKQIKSEDQDNPKEMSRKVINQYIIIGKLEEEINNYIDNQSLQTQQQKHLPELKNISQDLYKLVIYNSIKVLAALSVMQGQLYEQYRFKLLLIKLLLTQYKTNEFGKKIEQIVNQKRASVSQTQTQTFKEKEFKEFLVNLDKYISKDNQKILTACYGILYQQKLSKEIEQQIEKTYPQKDQQYQAEKNRLQISTVHIQQYQDQEKFEKDLIESAQNSFNTSQNVESDQYGKQQKEKAIFYNYQNTFKECMLSYLLKYIYENNKEIDALTKYHIECVLEGKQVSDKNVKKLETPKEQKKLIIETDYDKVSQQIVNDEYTFLQAYENMGLTFKMQFSSNQQSQNYHGFKHTSRQNDQQGSSTAVQFIRKFIPHLFDVKDKQQLQVILTQFKSDIKQIYQSLQQEKEKKVLIQQICSQLIREFAKQQYSDKEMVQNLLFKFILSFVETKQITLAELIAHSNYDQIITLIIQQYIRQVYNLLIDEIDETGEENIWKQQLMTEIDKDVSIILSGEQYIELLENDEADTDEYNILLEADEKLKPFILNQIDYQVNQMLYKQLQGNGYLKNYYINLRKLINKQNQSEEQAALDFAKQIKCLSTYSVILQMLKQVSQNHQQYHQTLSFDKQMKNLNIYVDAILNNKIKDDSVKQQQQQKDKNNEFSALMSTDNKQTPKTVPQIVKDQLQSLCDKQVKLPALMVIKEVIKRNPQTIYTTLQKFVQNELIDEKQLKQDLLKIFKSEQHQQQTLINTPQGKQLAEYVNYEYNENKQ